MTTATTGASPTELRTLSAAGVFALKNQPAGGTGNKEAFLRAICGSMSEAEAADLERRIDALAERLDDAP